MVKIDEMLEDYGSLYKTDDEWELEDLVKLGEKYGIEFDEKDYIDTYENKDIEQITSSDKMYYLETEISSLIRRKIINDNMSNFIEDCANEIAGEIYWKLENGEKISADNVTDEEYNYTDDIRWEMGSLAEEILEKRYGITLDDLCGGITKKELDERKSD